MKKNTRVLACQIDANLQKEMKDYVIKWNDSKGIYYWTTKSGFREKCY